MTGGKSTFGRIEARTARSGFTLIELVVVVTVLTIVAALVAASAAKTLGRSRELKCVASIRESARTVALYAADYKGWMPTPPLNPHSRLDWLQPRALIQCCPKHGCDIPYFAERMWPYLMTAAMGEYQTAWSCPSTDVTDPRSIRVFGTGVVYCNATAFSSTYAYSAAFLASARFWTPTSTQPRSELRGQLEASVLFPSRKVVFFEILPIHVRRRIESAWSMNVPRAPVAFADGSAAVKNFREALPGIRNQLEHVHDPTVFVMLNTVHGVHGRDF